MCVLIGRFGYPNGAKTERERLCKNGSQFWHVAANNVKLTAGWWIGKVPRKGVEGLEP